MVRSLTSEEIIDRFRLALEVNEELEFEIGSHYWF